MSSEDPIDLIEQASGMSYAQIVRGGIGAWFLAIFASVIAGIQAATEFLLLPFVLFVDVGTESVQALLIEPLGLTRFGLIASAEGVLEFGLFGLPISVIVILVTFGIIVAFLALSVTSNVLPGVFVDNPVWDFFFGTPEEEFDDPD